MDLVEVGENEFTVTVAAEKGCYHDRRLPGSWSVYIKVRIVDCGLWILKDIAGWWWPRLSDLKAV